MSELIVKAYTASGGKIIEWNGDLYYLTKGYKPHMLKIICWDRIELMSRDDWRDLYNPNTDDRFDCALCLGWVKERDSNRVWVYTAENCKH